jgi:pentapeptide MXKDX repeat protein
VDIGALQTVAKLVEAASYFVFCDTPGRSQRRMPCHMPKLFSMLAVTKVSPGPSLSWRPKSPSRTGFLKGTLTMTISTRIALGISAAALSLGLALAPAAFAQDAMKKDDGMMKKDSMSKDAMKKDDGMMKKDSMSKDSMKKDDGMMKKDSMSK